MKNNSKKYIIIMIAFIALASAALLMINFGKKLYKIKMSDKYHIEFVIPVSEPEKFDKHAIIEKFHQRFNTNIICNDCKKDNDRNKDGNEFILTDGTNFNMITIEGKPLSIDFLDLIFRWDAFEMNEKEKNLLSSHKGYILLESRFSNHNKIDTATFTARILSILLQNNNALGAVNISACMYRPKRLIKDVRFDKPFDAYRLYRFYILVHHVKEEKRIWIHTHGMEQFGAPDIQIFYPDNDNADSLYQEVIDETATYLIENGPIVKPGETVDVDGRGAIYRAKAVSGDKDHPYGTYGAIELEKCH